MDKQQYLVVQITEDEDGRYTYTCGPGMSVEEVCFSLAGLAKVFVREGWLKRCSQFTRMIRDYINDPDNNEIKETDNGQKEK